MKTQSVLALAALAVATLGGVSLARADQSQDPQVSAAWMSANARGAKNAIDTHAGYLNAGSPTNYYRGAKVNGNYGYYALYPLDPNSHLGWSIWADSSTGADGAWGVHGLHEQHFLDLGFSQSPLWFPRGDTHLYPENCQSAGNCTGYLTPFYDGAIWSKFGAGAYAVYGGPVYNAYWGAGEAAGVLGYPTSDPHAMGSNWGYIGNTFERGWIQYSENGGLSAGLNPTFAGSPETSVRCTGQAPYDCSSLVLNAKGFAPNEGVRSHVCYDSHYCQDGGFFPAGPDGVVYQANATGIQTGNICEKHVTVFLQGQSSGVVKLMPVNWPCWW